MLQTMTTFIYAEDLENALRNICPEQFKNMPVKLTGAKLSEDGNSVYFKHVVYSDSEDIKQLRGDAIGLNKTHFSSYQKIHNKQ